MNPFFVYSIEVEEKKLRDASLAASSRLKRALLKEKETKDSLQKALNELQVRTAHFPPNQLVRPIYSKRRATAVPNSNEFDPAVARLHHDSGFKRRI